MMEISAHNYTWPWLTQTSTQVIPFFKGFNVPHLVFQVKKSLNINHPLLVSLSILLCQKLKLLHLKK